MDDEPLEILRRVAKHLKSIHLPTQAGEAKRPIKWAEKAANNIEDYLSGKKKSLDTAFALKKKRAPTKENEHIALASEVYKLRLAGKSWIETYDIISTKDYTVTDESTIRKIFKKHFAKLAADDVQLDED